MTKILCQICLRTGFDDAEEIDERLSDFHDELCDYDIFHNDAFQFCPICKYLLKKFYNFRQKCRRAHMILKKSKLKKVNLEALQELPNNIKFGALDNQKFYYCSYVSTNEILPYFIFNIANDTNTTNTHTDVKPASVEVKLEATETEAAETEAVEPEVTVTQIVETVEDPLITQIKQDTECDLKPEELGGIAKSLNQQVQDYLIEDNQLPNKLDIIDNALTNKEDSENEIDDISIIEDSEKEIDDLSNVVIDSDSAPEEEKPKPKRACRKRKPKLDDVTGIISVEELEFIKKKLNLNDKKAIKMHEKLVDFKTRVSFLLDNKMLDLGENVDLDKEKFLKMLEKCDKSLVVRRRGLLKKVLGPGDTEKLKKFLLFLLKRYNPEYESTFDIEYLTTREKKLAEFKSRKQSKEYLSAEYKCDICFKAFELPKLLEYHNKWHETSRPYACDICGMRFSALKNLNEHIRTSHYSVYRCKLCPIVTNLFQAMVNHYNQHKGMQYKCEICLSEYNSQSCLNSHRLSHAYNKCSQCTRRFASVYGLRNHIKYKHPEVESTELTSPPVVTCKKCEMDFETREDLRKHSVEMHQRTDIYKCRFRGCVDRFETSAELRAHALATDHVQRCKTARPRGLHLLGAREAGNVLIPRKRRPDKLYRTCPICQEQVPNKSGRSLYKHHAEKHPSVPYQALQAADILCEQCGKYVHHSMYREHLNKHSGAKPYACKECGARFHMRKLLAAHSDRHRPPRYKCKECGKMFLTSANLFCHRRTHIGDRKFKCEICFKGFLHASSLKEHINGVHNQIRRVKKSNKIIKTHIGDRKFKCEICFKGFLHASSLKEHINGVHNQIRRVKKAKKVLDVSKRTELVDRQNITSI